MKKLLQFIIPSIFILTGIYVAMAHTLKIPENRCTLIALIVTAFIYYLQWLSMRNQERNSKRSFDNQEKILEAPKKIAAKQYDFNVFTLRLNLRNELQTNFTQALSVTGLDISDDVNTRLLKMGKTLNDIEFAFPKNAELTKLIAKFKKLCTDFTNLAFEKEIIIDCSEKKRIGSNGDIIEYKKCIRVLGNGQFFITNQTKFDELKINNKLLTIITGIIHKYINQVPAKDGIEFMIHTQFTIKKDEAITVLKKITDILDKHIILNP